MKSLTTILLKAAILISLPARGAHLLGAGTFVPYFNKAQNSDDGSTEKFELIPYFGYGQQFHISGPHYFMPEIALAYYHQTAEKVKKRTIFLHYNFAYVLSSTLLLRYGISTYWHTVSGEGGTVRLRNGDGYTKFRAPDESQTTYFSTLDFGAEYFFTRARGVRLDFNMMSPLNGQERALNYILTYNWYL